MFHFGLIQPVFNGLVTAWKLQHDTNNDTKWQMRQIFTHALWLLAPPWSGHGHWIGHRCFKWSHRRKNQDRKSKWAFRNRHMRKDGCIWRCLWSWTGPINLLLYWVLKGRLWCMPTLKSDTGLYHTVVVLFVQKIYLMQIPLTPIFHFLFLTWSHSLPVCSPGFRQNLSVYLHGTQSLYFKLCTSYKMSY